MRRTHHWYQLHSVRSSLLCRGTFIHYLRCRSGVLFPWAMIYGNSMQLADPQITTEARTGDQCETLNQPVSELSAQNVIPAESALSLEPSLCAISWSSSECCSWALLTSGSEAILAGSEPLNNLPRKLSLQKMKIE